MGDWDIDPPAKADSSSGQSPLPGRSAGSQPSPGGRSPVSGQGSGGQAPVSGRTAPQSAAPDAPALRERRARFSYPWLGVAVITLVIGLMAGFFIARSQTSGEEAALADANARLGELQFVLSRSEERNWTYYRANEALKEELKQVTSSTSTTVLPVDAKGTYGPGLYVVSEDIPAGTYEGVVNGSIGYWARLKDTDGAIASIIENGIAKGPFVLTIVSGDKAVELQDVTLTER